MTNSSDPLFKAIADALARSTFPPPAPQAPASRYHPPETPLGSIFAGPNFDLPTPRPGSSAAVGLTPRIGPQKARRVFFSFHFDDIMRVNNVRNSLKFQKGNVENAISAKFYDRSLWEASKRTNPESLRALIRNGMRHSSVVCVLIGSETWSRPWVRYEIARSVVDRRGLVAVDLNNLVHHGDGYRHALGLNPLDYLGVAKMENGSFRIAELTASGWRLYDRYTLSVPLPSYLNAPPAGHVIPLSEGTYRYDFALHDGDRNLGRWIGLAAALASRN